MYQKTMFEMPGYLRDRSRLLEAIEYMVGAAIGELGLITTFTMTFSKTFLGTRSVLPGT